MSEIQWRVGDTGLTRGGDRYEVVRVDGPEVGIYPIDARIEGHGYDRCFTVEGLLWQEQMTADDPGVPDRLTPVHTDPSATTDERLVELSGRVLVAAAEWGEGHDPGELARWAVDAARALLRECGA